ncbi:IS3 family transposase [Amycolatopsis sp. EV170708-02-1]|uniref:IS3 family transposase n=1 Tax=Amycolatopsis sp. EV170708-02-1 TaxID=2919322 RepID=UPI0037C0AC43
MPRIPRATPLLLHRACWRLPSPTAAFRTAAVAEAFFATLKTEIGATIWQTRNRARQNVFAYLHYYNHTRLHSTLGHNTPAETRTNHHDQVSAA